MKNFVTSFLLLFALFMGANSYANNGYEKRLPVTEKLTALVASEAAILNGFITEAYNSLPSGTVQSQRMFDAIYGRERIEKAIYNSYHSFFQYMREEGILPSTPIYNAILFAHLEIREFLKEINLKLQIQDKILNNYLTQLEDKYIWQTGSGSGSNGGNGGGSCSHGGNGNGSGHYDGCCDPGHGTHCSHCDEHHDPSMPCYY